ncbi:MAG TPA: alpha/beta fold hydrolase [Candidatus Acidoferrales bacterium]|nr:alpha/beta fold hydrolase [Candidatus Acidoferrales bacterium]
MPFYPLVRNSHLQTVLAHYWKRPDPDAAHPVERRLFRTEPDVQVLVLSQRPVGEARGEVVMVHGLEGSGEAAYMRSLAAAALHEGFAAHRFHMRTCGGTETLCNTLYHAGLTGDLREVLRQLRAEGCGPAFLVGFSLGGNVVLKLAGELGDAANRLVRGVCAVSVPLDLAACARRIGEPDNRIYETRFVRRMRNRLCATGRYRREEFDRLRSIVALDDRFTAPSFGFGNAANYYRTQSSLGYLEGVRVPTLLIQAKDDIFIPFGIFDSPTLRSNPCIELLATEHGGHLGFLGRRPHRLWLDEAIMNWVKSRNG